MKKCLLLIVFLMGLSLILTNCGGETQTRPETYNISQGNGKKYQVTLKCSVTGIERYLIVSANSPDEARLQANRWAKQTGRGMSSVIKIVLKND